jgi:hypothetical protein
MSGRKLVMRAATCHACRWSANARQVSAQGTRNERGKQKSASMTPRPPAFLKERRCPLPVVGALWPDPASVLTAAGVKPGRSVIDLCSGDGRLTLGQTREEGRSSYAPPRELP